MILIYPWASALPYRSTAGNDRFLSSLVITSGDRELGLQEILIAARKGDLLKELARQN